MEIDDDDDDDQNEISDEEHRGIVLPSVVQPSIKQQINRKTKQQVQQQMEKESRQNQDGEELDIDHDINSIRKKYQEKVEF